MAGSSVLVANHKFVVYHSFRFVNFRQYFFPFDALGIGARSVHYKDLFFFHVLQDHAIEVYQQTGVHCLFFHILIFYPILDIYL